MSAIAAALAWVLLVMLKRANKKLDRDPEQVGTPRFVL